VICSTLTANGAQVTMEAMASGALDIITKPKVGLKHFFEESKTLLTDSIRAAKSARMSKVRAQPTPAMRNEPKLNADAVIPQLSRPLISTTGRVVALGTSTGGTQALETILTALPCASPGILVVQHMPEQFTRAFAERLDGVCNVRVKEAEQGDEVVPGLVLIAPGGAHMLLRRSGTQYRAQIKDGPLVSRHRPSVDVLFRSVAQVAGRNATGIIMTGMGDDGAHGLEEMHAAGALTVAQDEATCVVYGMPKEAVARGAVDISIPLQEIPKVILANQSRSRFLENQQLQ
jgi:two-component system chemotaxis response regulator CheB